MSEVAVATPSYLVRALDGLRSLGLTIKEPNSGPIAALLSRIAEVDETRTTIIARTLVQQEVFDTVVADQISQMRVGERYERIAKDFDSIRVDAKRMVDQLDDGKLSIGDRISNVIMKFSRGDIADRFDSIRKVNAEVTADVQEQVQREAVILNAYREYRGALKQAEVLAFEILDGMTPRVEAAQRGLDAATAAVEANTEQGAERARLELARDEALRTFQDEDDRYQIAKDLAENLSVAYNVTEVTMARMAQSHTAKERIFKQSVSFFATNTTVLSALKASFTGMAGLAEATRTLDAMKEGTSRSLETLAEIGGKVQEAALRSGYGPTIRADAVRKLVDSVVDYQERSAEIVAEMRTLSTSNAQEIRASVEDGKRRLTQIARKGEKIAA